MVHASTSDTFSTVKHLKQQKCKMMCTAYPYVIMKCNISTGRIKYISAIWLFCICEMFPFQPNFPML